MNDTQITLQGWLGGPVTVRQAIDTFLMGRSDLPR